MTFERIVIAALIWTLIVIVDVHFVSYRIGRLDERDEWRAKRDGKG